MPTLRELNRQVKRSFSYPVTRVLMIILNTMCVISAIVLLVTGFLLTIRTASFKHIKMISDRLPQEIMAYGLITQAAILIIVHTLGLIAIVTESLISAILYLGSIIFATVTQFILFTIVLKTSRIVTLEHIREKLSNLWKLIFGSSIRTHEHAETNMDFIQATFKCCGVDGALDYEKVPLSCCKLGSGNCTSEDVYTKGCREAINDFLTENSSIFENIIIAINALLVLTIVVATLHSINLMRKTRSRIKAPRRKTKVDSPHRHEHTTHVDPPLSSEVESQHSLEEHQDSVSSDFSNSDSK